MQMLANGLNETQKRGLTVAVIALLAAGCAHKDGKTMAKAETPAPTATQPAQAAPNAPNPVMDQQALSLLKRMSETLAAAKSFSYRTRSSAEVPAPTGQFLTFFADSEVALERPNKLRGKVSGDIPAFQIFYDGGKVTAYDPRKNVYAITDAPSGIEATLAQLSNRVGIEFPAAELLSGDPYAAMTKDLISAMVVGPGMVDGVPVEHLAFMGPGVNWEIWIDSGSRPLPLRLALTYKEAVNFPRFVVEFSNWNLKPKFQPGQFALKKPADAKRIEFDTEAGSVIKNLEEQGAPK